MTGTRVVAQVMTAGRYVRLNGNNKHCGVVMILQVHLRTKHEYNNKTVLLRDTVHQISRGESAAAELTTGQFYFYPVMSKMQNSINI